LDNKLADAINTQPHAPQKSSVKFDAEGSAQFDQRNTENGNSAKQQEAKPSSDEVNQSPARPADSPYYSVVAESQLKPEDYQKNDGRHNQEANRQLYDRMQADPGLANSLEKHYPGITKGVSPGPRGAFSRTSPTPHLTWHHDPQRPGVLQLMSKEQHQAAGAIQQSLHPNQKGGRENWGGGSDKR
jgi:hypothetical protein